MTVRTIWKYPLESISNEITMPTEATIVHVGSQSVIHPDLGRWAYPVLWAEVETEAELEVRHFVVYGTGHPIAPVVTYVGTACTGDFVLHVYEATP